MARYSKTHSNYLLRKVHTTVKGGTIFERDWGTLGERHVIEPGKKKIYADGNFLFTDNNMPGFKKRNFTGNWEGPYTMDNLDPNVNSDVNDVSILGDSNDLRDYAYYGSAAELIRATIEKIIREFPGRIYAVDNRVQRLSDDETAWEYLFSIQSDSERNFTLTWDDENAGLSVVRNPFVIDLYNQDPILNPLDNRMRNIPLSWKLYVNGGAALTSWNVWIKPYDGCENNYDVIYEITYTDSASRTGHIWGLRYNRGIIWCTDDSTLDIHPNDTVIENYFSGLRGLEAKLLSRRVNPMFTAKFLTPIKRSEIDERYTYIERRYTWPSTGYCIDVDTVAYYKYVDRLNRLAITLDELWCDNLWSNMTHEAIRNFDWTYTREYEEGDADENILGGTRMEGMLRIMGRFYDDIKRYIDGISLKNCITYDGVGNVSSASVSDKAELRGWEVFTTKQYNNRNLIIGNFVDTLPKIGPRFGQDSTIDHSTWYNSLNPEYVSQNDVDNDFMRRLVLSSGTIFRSKGTRHSIEMTMAMFGIGEDDYTIEERYYSVEPKRRDEIFWFYEPNDEPLDNVEYEEIEDVTTMEGYLEKMNYKFDGNCAQHVFLDNKYYDLRGDMTVGEFCTWMNDEKTVRKNYRDDEFSGVPLKDVFIKNQHCIVPYFSQKKLYDGNVQFETRGGWGKMVDRMVSIKQLSKEEFDYLETVPYLEIVQNCGELMAINMFDVKGKEIYYVMDLSDLSEYTESIPSTTSHFFKLTDPQYPNLFSSWKNVPTGINASDPDEFNEYCSELDEDGNPVRPLMFGVNYDDWRLARYLDSIMLDNIGNNPHVGFGVYDLGMQYRDYLEQPFKFVAEHYGFSNFTYCDLARQFRYAVTEHCGEKIKNLVYRDDTDDNVVNFNCADDVADCVTFSCEERYYEPRKILVIKNNLDSDAYRRYFMDVIIKYLLQVIASTTILVLVGFKPNDCISFECETIS